MIRVRTREVEICGEKVTIASFSNRQSDAYIEEVRNMLRDKDKLPVEAWRDHNRRYVLASLERLAINGQNGEPKWDAERILDVLDPVQTRDLLAEILKFSGLSVETPAGEAGATSTLPKSEVA